MYGIVVILVYKLIKTDEKITSIPLLSTIVMYVFM